MRLVWVLPWIHRVFSLMKRWGLGTYHGLRRKHVDTYLNEFVFRYNRRFYRHVSLARTNASIEAAELSGMAARRMRPDRVSRYFARFRLGFAWLVPRSITSTVPAMRIFPDLAGSKKRLSARNGISAWSTSTTPSSGSRWGSIIDRRSHMTRHLADRPRVVSVIGEPGIGSVPVGEQRGSGLHALSLYFSKVCRFRPM
jgi:hypothetical protein